MMSKNTRCFTFSIAAALSSFLGSGRSLAEDGVSFTDPVDFGVGRSPRSVTVGDFNGDGIQDLAVANFASNDVSILFGKGDGTFSLAQTVPVGTSPYFVTIGDFNGDKVPDLAVANSGSNGVSILLGKGNGTFEAARNVAAGSRPWSVAVGDFNGDKIQDLVVANSG